MDKLRNVYFKNYKLFNAEDDFCIKLNSYISLIIGRNNSGKSSCIDIVEALYNADYYKSVFNYAPNLSISADFELSRDTINKYFSSATTGGDINGNHNSFGRQYINSLLHCDIILLPNKTQEIHISQQQPVVNNRYGKDIWPRIAKSYEDFQKNYVFRRLNAERDIVPESASPTLTVDSNGNGATNIIRRFINNSSYDETLVEKILLQELNRIMSPDTIFNSIRVQEVSTDSSSLWEIYLEEKDSKRYPISKTGSGLKTILLILINLHIIPKIPTPISKKFIYAFEEVENNLHPALQRKVFDYLYNFAKENNTQIFLTTHSHIAINAFSYKENIDIYHINKCNNLASIQCISNRNDMLNILDDLNLKASDLLQSNGIIWVEGPSDRIYIKKWLEIFCDETFEEGVHYQFLYYGGRCLSHYTASEEETTANLISVLSTNRNAAILIDSDKKTPASKINNTKKRIQTEFQKNEMMCWITKGKEIENYLSSSDINKTFNSKLKVLAPFEVFPDYIRSADKSFTSHKVDFARKISANITFENSQDILDLKKQIMQLASAILKWNS